MNSFLQKIAACFSNNSVQRIRQDQQDEYIRSPRTFNDNMEFRAFNETVDFRVFDKICYFSSEVESTIFPPTAINLDILKCTFEERNKLTEKPFAIKEEKEDSDQSQIIGKIQE